MQNATGKFWKESRQQNNELQQAVEGVCCRRRHRWRRRGDCWYGYWAGYLATGLLILVRLVKCVIINNSLIKSLVLKTPQETGVVDGHSLWATGRGDVILRMNLPNKKIQMCKLSDVLYVSDLLHNLLSVSKAADNRKTFEFWQSHCNIIDNKLGVIATATKCGNLYYLNCARSNLSVKESHTAMKWASTDQKKESIWHRRYGHLGARNLERIAKEQLVHGFDYEPKKESSFCEPCVDGKQSTLPFPKTGGKVSWTPWYRSQRCMWKE